MTFLPNSRSSLFVYGIPFSILRFSSISISLFISIVYFVSDNFAKLKARAIYFFLLNSQLKNKIILFIGDEHVRSAFKIWDVVERMLPCPVELIVEWPHDLICRQYDTHFRGSSGDLMPYYDEGPLFGEAFLLYKRKFRKVR